MVKMNFGGIIEDIITSKEYSLNKALSVLKDEVIAVIGYGIQGPGQALNLRDNGFNVIVGQRKSSDTWNKAKNDGWIENKNLFSIEEALDRGTIICYLLSDAGQIQMWNIVSDKLTKGKTLYFSHGFGITYKNQTGIIPPKNIDVILVAPKGSGTSLRNLYLKGQGLNSSYAIYQDFSGKALDKVLSMGIGIGAASLFYTTFKKEVYSDLTGERGTLLGAIAGIFEAQYDVLRENGHSPSEAFNETVEEFTQSLMPLISDKGMSWMYANCSTTAQRGALDWKPEFKKATKPVFEKLYESVKNGTEARNVINANSNSQYRNRLNSELKEMENSELWQAGITVRKLRYNKKS
ncbi:MAG: ketol-acid reductoisomerase [Bacteroides sp.]|nr:MAG: ketol-acid reductoisomerase [Bacteroides sp.]